MSHFESLVAVSSVITFIFSMIEFVPSTLYFLSGFSLTCLLTQVVFPEPGNPTIMITYNNASSTTILLKKGQQYAMQLMKPLICICTNKCSVLQSSLTREMHLTSLSNIQIYHTKGSHTVLTSHSFLVVGPLVPCTRDSSPTDWMKVYPSLAGNHGSSCTNTKKHCSYSFAWQKWFYAL